MKSAAMLVSVVGLRAWAQVAPAAAPPAPTATVQQVVGLLKSLQNDLQQEAAADKDVFAKIQCWCKDNIKEKTRAIADQKARIAQESSAAAGSKAAALRLQEEITQLKAELAKSQDSLGSATSLRDKQGTDFKAEETELANSIKALTGAIKALENGQNGINGTAFLDLGKANPLTEVSKELERFSSMLAGTITPSQKRLIVALSQGGLLRGSYTPRSGEVLGILKQMKETFEDNLQKLRNGEASNVQSYADLQTAKTHQVSATQSAIQQKQLQLAQAVDGGAKADQDSTDTKNSESLDQAFLTDIQAKCAAFEQQYNDRQTLRNTESVGLAQALVILTNTAAQSTLSRTFQPASLIQIHMTPATGALKAAAALLEKTAAKSSDARVSALAATARLDGVEKVLVAIDKLIQQLSIEGAAEQQQRDSCAKRTADNSLAQQQVTQTSADATSRVSAAQIKVQDLAGSVVGLKQDITDLQAQLKKLAADRALEQKDFQKAVADQRNAEKLLQDAINILTPIYAAKAPASLVQGSNQTAPAGFGTYGAGRNGGSVLVVLQQLLADAKAMEQKALDAEAAAKATFEKVTADTTSSIQAKQASIVDKNAAKADAEKQLLSAQQDVAAGVVQLSAIGSTGAALSTECVSLLKDFDARQAARSQEMASLAQAKGILAAPAQAKLPVAPVAASPAAPR